MPVRNPEPATLAMQVGENDGASTAGRRFLSTTPARAVLLLASGMAAAVIVGAAVTLFDTYRRAELEVRAEISGLGRILSEQTARTFDGILLSMHGVRERLSDEVGHRLELNSFLVHALLQSRTLGLPQVKSMFVVDAEGYVVNSSRQDFGRPIPVDQRSFFRYFADGGSDEFYVSNPERAQIDGEWTFYVSMPLNGPSGQPRGLVVVAVQIGHFESLYESIAHTFDARIQLLNREGLLMAGNVHQDALYATRTGNLEIVSGLSAPGVEEGATVIRGNTGGSSFVAYRRIASYPLVTSVAIDERTAYAEWRQVASVVAISVLLVLLLLACAAWLTIRYLNRQSLLDCAIRDNDERLRYMVHSVDDAIVTIDTDMQIVLCNTAACRLFGGCRESGEPTPAADFLAGIGTDQSSSLLGRLQAGLLLPAGVSRVTSFELMRNDTAVFLEMRLSTFAYHGQLLLTAIFRDLSERREAERQMSESNRQLKELSNALQEVRERERAWISRELHDELGQALTGIRMEVSWIGRQPIADCPEIPDKVAEIKRQIDQTIATVRRLSSDLRPLVLDDLGFAAAAGWYVEQFSERSGLRVNLSMPEDEPARGSTIAITLFRILQESLTNIARHAAARSVDIGLSVDESGWRLSIRDDGIGFARGADAAKGIGILGMRERVEAIGGCFSINGVSRQGTVVEAFLPGSS